MLRRIQYPNNEQINFEYEKRQSSYDASVSETINVYLGGQSAMNVPCENLPSRRCVTRINSEITYLKKIRFSDNTEIVFDYSQKQGLPNNMLELSNLRVFDLHGNLISRHEFLFQAIESTISQNLYLTNTYDYYRFRTFLVDLNTYDNSGNIVENHHFSYQNPELLPPRLKFSQDMFGYYNGKNNNTSSISSSFVSHLYSNPIITNYFPQNFVPADRSVYDPVKEQDDESVAGFGMLSEIQYPSSAITEFKYEPNTINKEIEQWSDPEDVTLDFEYYNDSEFQNSDTDIINDIQEDQLAKIDFSFNIDELGTIPIGGSGDKTLEPLQFVFQVKNLSNSGEQVLFQKPHQGVDPIPVQNNSLLVDMDVFDKSYHLQFKANNNYEIKFIISRPYTTAKAHVTYNNSTKNIVSVNEPTGGMRIKKINYFDRRNSKSKEKNYFYASHDEISKSSGVVLTPKNFNKSIENKIHYPPDNVIPGNTPLYYLTCKYLSISSSSIFTVYHPTHVGYETVIESNSEDFSKGFTEHVFDSSISISLPEMAYGEPPVGLQLYLKNNIGEIQTISTFSKEGAELKLLNRKEFNYEEDSRYAISLPIYYFQENATIVDGTYTPVDPQFTVERFVRARVELSSIWRYLKSETNFDFTNSTSDSGMLSQSTTYEYSNTTYPLITKVTKYNHYDKNIEEYNYAFDELNNKLSTSEMSSSEVLLLEDMVNANIVNQPVLTRSFIEKDGNSSLRSKLFNTFKSKNNFYVKDKTSFAKGSHDLEERITYHDYDDYGNPLEVSKADGTRISYIYGYNDTQPVAQLTGMSYSAIPQDIIDDIHTYSSADDDTCFGSSSTSCSESQLRSSLNALRTHYSSNPAVQVTTYTYDPLIGVTSITDPRGETSYYEYDDFNRLKAVKDAEGNLLKETKYNYRN